MIWKKCQNMLRWSGQNANQKVGTDKMPTTEKSPDKMPTFGWHYVRLAFCPVGILSYHRRTLHQTPNKNTLTNLTPRQETMSPAIAGARKFLFNSSDPNLQKKMYQFHSGEIIRKKNSFNLPPPSSCKSFSFFQSIVRRRWDLYLRLFVLLFAIDVLIF